jgi:hypothetical protein
MTLEISQEQGQVVNHKRVARLMREHVQSQIHLQD